MSKQIRKFAKRLQREMVRQKWSDEQISSVTNAPEYQSIEQIVAGLKRYPSEIYAPDWIPAGCKVVDDVVLRKFEMEDLEWLPVLDAAKSESFLWGETMRDRAKAWDADPGLVAGKYFWEHQDKIPAGIAVPLTGTLLFDTKECRLKICQLYREKQDGPLLRNYPVLAFGWYRQHHLPRIKHA